MSIAELLRRRPFCPALPRWTLGLALAWGIAIGPLAAPPAIGQEANEEAGEDANRPLFEQEPYDQVVLNDADHTVVDVLFLNNRQEPDREKLKKTDKLVVKRVDDPSEEFEILWSDIAEIRFFERRILEQAAELVHRGAELVREKKAQEATREFDEAFVYFDFLKHNYPETQGLDAGLCDYLYEDAGHWHKLDKFENALALLDELYLVDPQYAKLEGALGAITEKIAEQDVDRGDYPAARQLLVALKRKYPKHASIAKLERQWADAAREILGQAKSQLEADQPREAWKTALRATSVWPRLPETQPFLQELYQRHPRVLVGVVLPGGSSPADRIVDWAGRRQNRLLHRLLVEYTGPGANGGHYACPFGVVDLTDIGRRLVFDLRQGIRWSGGEQLTGFDIARRLLSLADLGQSDADPGWGELFGGVDVQDIFKVGVDLRWTHVQPLALLEAPLVPSSQTEAAATLGPYSLLETQAADTSFVANPRYFAAQPKQPREVIERFYADSTAALLDLRQGQIQVVDRLPPWDIEKFRSQADVVVEQYVLPTVHCLLPNRKHPFTGHRAFRRALVYGIDRAAILKEQLLRTGPRTGCQVVSGPFPIGMSFDDPLRYAYNSDVAVRPWNRRLAIALTGVALHDVSEAAKKKGAPEVKAVPSLVLAYPAHETARIACKAIQRHLKAAQIPVELRELEPGRALPADDDYDLVYAELVMQEPLTDAARLLGPDGIAGGATPYMVLALRQLSAATGWAAARKKLQEIHRLADDDTAVVPLWQLTEFFAYHRSLTGLGPQAVALYQDIEQWQGKYQLPAGTP